MVNLNANHADVLSAKGVLIRRLLVALIAGSVVTAGSFLISGDPWDALTAAGLTATVAALVMALFIYLLQQETQGAAHAELLEQLQAQGEIIEGFSQQVGAQSGTQALTPDQRAAVEKKFGAGSIAAAWTTGAGRGNRPRLVRLTNGELLTVYSGGRLGKTYVRRVTPTPLDE